METRWVTYVCPSGHKLVFGHLVSSRGRFQSTSPSLCNCGLRFTLAVIREND